MPEPQKRPVGAVSMHPIRTIHGAGAETKSWVLVCPRRGRLLPLAVCDECPHLRSVRFGKDEQGQENASAICDLDAGDTRRGFFPKPYDSKSYAATVTMPISTIAKGAVCVAKDLEVKALTELFLERGISGAPVLDEQGRLVGVVTKSDLLVDGLERGRGEGGVTVGDVMTPLVRALGDDATIGDAVTLMAEETIHMIPLVTAQGEVVGVVSALDVLRWFASRDRGL
jgi:CBS domain-containing protein